MNQKKSFLTQEQVIFAVVCAVLDLIIIIVANRFMAYPGLSPIMQSIIRRSWLFMMFFAMVCAGVGVALSKTYDMARAYFLESVILIVCGFWFGVSRDAICVKTPTAEQMYLFIVAQVFLTITMIVFQADIIFSHPLEALYLNKVSSDRPDVSALSVRQKTALIETLTADIQNSRGNEDYVNRSSRNTQHSSRRLREEGMVVDGSSNLSFDQDIDDNKNGAVMHRQNARYAVKADFDDQDDIMGLNLNPRPDVSGREGVKTPLHSKNEHKTRNQRASVDIDEIEPVVVKPKVEPLKPVPAQVDKNAYKKTPQSADKTEWDPVKVAQESAAHRKDSESSDMGTVISDHSPDSNATGERTSASQILQTPKPIKTDAQKPTASAAREVVPPVSNRVSESKTTEISHSRETVNADDLNPQKKRVVSDKKDNARRVNPQRKDARSGNTRTDNTTPKQKVQQLTPSSVARSKASADAVNGERRHDARKQAPIEPKKDKTADGQKQDNGTFEHIDIVWADPKPAKRRR